MPFSSFPFPPPSGATGGQHCSAATGQQRTQSDIQVPNSAKNNPTAASQRQEPFLYPEHDPLE